MSFQILKGNIIFTPESNCFKTIENGYIIYDGKTIVDVCDTIPDKYKNISVTDYGERLIMPGFVDLHTHAPQFENCGIGYDKELLPWLETYTFPEEGKFCDISYAKKVYSDFVEQLYVNGTTRSVLFGTIHTDSCLLLAKLVKNKGLGSYIGKVNMDRNAPPFLTEDTLESVNETKKYLEEFPGNDIVHPIITPRFVPTCSEKLMHELGELAQKFKLPVQSHLSENKGEIAWVKELHPECQTYGNVYDKYKLFGNTPTIMAHCVSSSDEEIQLIKEKNVFVAHCSNSNIDLSSGIAPIRKFLNLGISVGLGSDISGGHDLFLPRSIVSAVQASKIYQLYVDNSATPLNTAEAFYLATKGGGSFFGKVGSFEVGFSMDALVIDDRLLTCHNKRNIEERLQKFLYIGSNENIVNIYVAGKKIK